MKTAARREHLKQLVATKRLRCQAEIVAELKKLGFSVTQSCVSRDITRLGILKVNGVYCLPRSLRLSATHGEIESLDTAGDHLIVIRTEPGEAPPIALAIDHARFPEIVGTVAGDDTIFVAVRTADDQREAIKKIKGLFHLRETAPDENEMIR